MIRLTGGLFRGRSIQTPTGSRTRPTQAKLRQALFNSLQHSIPDARVLDLFAGSGALGFEALSRGASHVTFVEKAKSVVSLIEKNAALLEVKDQVRVIGDSIEHGQKLFLEDAPFDLILADPPYAHGWELKLLTGLPWDKLLAPQGYFCLEWGIQKTQPIILPDTLPFLVKTREKNYGDSVLTTYLRESK